MKSRKLIYHIFPANVLVTVGAMLAIIWYGSSTLQRFYMDETRSSLLAQAYSIEYQVQQYLLGEQLTELRLYLRKVAKKNSSRITLVSPDGTVLSDSLKDPQTMDNHKQRPEFVEAVTSGSGSSIRFSQTVGEEMLYSAIALYSDATTPQDNTITGLLRVSVPVTKLKKTLAKVKKDMAVAMFVVVIVAISVTIYVSQRISGPLEKMTRGAERFAVGELSQHLTPPNSVATEIATLSQALNSMADQLQERLTTVVSQRNELQTVLDSMLAAVISVDQNGKIVSLNSAASTLFGLDHLKNIGKPIQGLIRNIDLLQLIERAKKSHKTVEGEIELTAKGESFFLLANCVHLCGRDGQNCGLLLVLHDVTKLRLLENMRKDFVANVSHELKTPITSIKGYVETVLDDALQDRENGIQFLEIVLKKVDHLNAIIDHLLLLSRIEQQADADQIELHTTQIGPIVNEAVNSCSSLAEGKNISLHLDCPDDLTMAMHAVLLEQALTNLIVNAIRYSHEGSDVMIKVAERKEENEKRISISIQDFGVGIGPEHLPRLFERFYRSDRARSRKVGGTGLGLAIVKHIAQAHKGDVKVQSVEGQGATVTLNLPG